MISYLTIESIKMVIVVRVEDLKKLINDEIEAWQSLAGGPNLDAFEFDPKTVDSKELKTKGYYKNRESWVGGVRVNKLKQFLEEYNISGK